MIPKFNIGDIVIYVDEFEVGTNMEVQVIGKVEGIQIHIKKGYITYSISGCAMWINEHDLNEWEKPE